MRNAINRAHQRPGSRTRRIHNSNAQPKSEQAGRLNWEKAHNPKVLSIAAVQCFFAAQQIFPDPMAQQGRRPARVFMAKPDYLKSEQRWKKSVMELTSHQTQRNSIIMPSTNSAGTTASKNNPTLVGIHSRKRRLVCIVDLSE